MLNVKEIKNEQPLLYSQDDYNICDWNIRLPFNFIPALLYRQIALTLFLGVFIQKIIKKTLN